MSLKLISLNIEKDKHLPRVLSYLKKTAPDVVFLQEVFQDTLPFFEKTLGGYSAFAPMKDLIYDTGIRSFGLAVLSRYPFLSTSISYYYLDQTKIPKDKEGTPLQTARCLLHTTLLKDNLSYDLINTHFTWTPDGDDSPQQHKDLQRLVALLSKVPDFILGGDFNAPRGGKIFHELAARYQDNIPPHVTSTLDPHLHRAGHKQLVVDGLFTTSGYRVADVQVRTGLSDHCAVSATLKPVFS